MKKQNERQTSGFEQDDGLADFANNKRELIVAELEQNLTFHKHKEINNAENENGAKNNSGILTNTSATSPDNTQDESSAESVFPESKPLTFFATIEVKPVAEQLNLIRAETKNAFENNEQEFACDLIKLHVSKFC